MESRLPELRATRPVTVEVGQAAAETRRIPPAACVVAVGPIKGPWLSDELPEAFVRDSRFDGMPVGVEHLRFQSRSVVSRLPGLEDPRGPSLLRDAVDTILAAGAPSIDVLVGRVVGGRPWDFDDERVHRALDGFLNEMPGTLLLYPDFGGPVARGLAAPVSDDERAARIATALRRLEEGWRERYQIAFFDDPRLPDDHMDELLSALLGTDAAICRWAGSSDALRAQAWRSGAAAVVGMLASSNRSILGMVGHSCRLPEGRRAAKGRHALLRRTDPARYEPGWAEYALNLDLQEDEQRARIRSEPTFRRPMGGWPVSALRMVKAVHQRVMDAAGRFVFKPADPRHALALSAALMHSLRPFSSAGLLVGPGDEGEPFVVGTVDGDISGTRSLVADVSGTLRPWSKRVAVRVALRPNESPVMEVL